MTTLNKEISYIQIHHGWLHGLLTKDKFQLAADFSAFSGILGYDLTSQDGLVHLHLNGDLSVKRGWEWDGASGPTWDTESTIAASCAHDALYQLLQEDLLPMQERYLADICLYRLLRAGNAGWFRSWYWLLAVDRFGGVYRRMHGTGKQILMEKTSFLSR